jgi:hypothetical protein
MRRLSVVWLFVLYGWPFVGAAQTRQADDMNHYVVQAARQMFDTVGDRGYDINKAFTEDLSYGQQCCIRATGGGKTMCVAAVAEVLVRALSLYAKDSTSNEAFQKLPLRHWTGAKYLDLKPHLFQFKGTESRGPGDAFKRFRIGREVLPEKLIPGDLLAFSRFNGSGHAVVFLGYISENGKLTNDYAKSVIGFRYFSAQTSTNGVGYRNAYFGSITATACPPSAPKGSDCGIIRERFMNAGRLVNPKSWEVDSAIIRLQEDFKKKLRASQLGISNEEISQKLGQDLPSEYSVDFSE